MNILFIGNSYTYFHDMPTLFSRLCGCSGKQARVFSVTRGGRKLQENLRSEDECTRQLEAVLRENAIQVCFLQEHSVVPITDVSQFRSSLQGLMHKLGPQVRFVLYETWARKAGSDFLAELRLTPRSMAQRLFAAYGSAAAELGTELSPVGECFLEIYEKHPEIELYDPDLTHPSYEGSCLAAIVHFRTLFGEYPADTGWLGLSADVQDVFRQTVEQVFRK